MNIQSLLESSNQYKVVMDDAKKLSQKWTKSGLLEGLKSENDKNTMSILLENQAKQLVVEQSQTGGSAGVGGAGYSAEGWNGVALPLVRRVFGEIAAKEFVSVQPMNLPSGLVFYLDFKYGTDVKPFQAGGSLYGANKTTNVTDIASASLYGAGHFGYSINQFSASVTNTVTASAVWSDFNLDSDYSASAAAGSWKKVLVPLTLAPNYDANAVRAFIITSGSFITAGDNLQTFTAVSNNTASFIITGSIVKNAAPAVTLFYEIGRAHV